LVVSPRGRGIGLYEMMAFSAATKFRGRRWLRHPRVADWWPAKYVPQLAFEPHFKAVVEKKPSRLNALAGAAQATDHLDEKTLSGR